MPKVRRVRKGVRHTTALPPAVTAYLSNASRADQTLHSEEHQKNSSRIFAASKKEKRQEKKKRFLERLCLPGSAAKFVKKASSSSSSSSSLSLSDLDESLMIDTLATEKTYSEGRQLQPKTLHSTSRKVLVDEEVKQFSSVLAHPAFQSNPLAAIREHLTNTYAREDARSAEWARLTGEAKADNGLLKSKEKKKKKETKVYSEVHSGRHTGSKQRKAPKRKPRRH